MKYQVSSQLFQNLKKKADECYDNAEKPDVDMATLLSKGNTFQKSIKEKEIVLNDLKREVENLKKEKRKLMCK